MKEEKGDEKSCCPDAEPCTIGISSMGPIDKSLVYVSDKSQ